LISTGALTTSLLCTWCSALCHTIISDDLDGCPEHYTWIGIPQTNPNTLVKTSLYPYITRTYSCMTIISTETTQPLSGTID
jgi:hypothetical protein